MGKTKRRRASRQDRQLREGERQFEREYNQRAIDEIRAEAEQIVNERALGEIAYAQERQVAIAEEKALREPFSVQSSPYQEPVSMPNLIWWTGGSVDSYVPVAEYTNPKRQLDLATFAVTAPLLLNAEAVLVKKVISLDWYIEAGRNQARKWQEFFLNVENYKGWDHFVAKWVRAYSESDRGGYAEIVRSAPSWAVNEYHQLTDRGQAAFESGADMVWPIVDLRVLDSAYCRPAVSETWPLLFNSPYSGKPYKLRKHQFIRLLDMPSPSIRFPNMGLCAVSRAMWAAQEDKMITQYTMEKLSENPGAGLVAANVNPKLLETALKSVKAARDARGVVYYKGLIFLPVLDPSGRFSLEFLSFSGLPDGFDRGQVYNILKEVVAAAFGIDVLELGSMPGNQLGSAQQATVMAKKSRGKGVGTIAQGIERGFRQRLLPTTVGFGFSSQDLEERLEKAEVDAILFKNAALMSSQIGLPAELALQYLVDTEAVPKEYLGAIGDQDLTPSEIIDDTEATGEKAQRGDLVRIYRDGSIKAVFPRAVSYTIKQVERVVPDGRPLPAATKKDAEVTSGELGRINADWDKEMPEYAGLLDATLE
jgi:hypothetical protein